MKKGFYIYSLLIGSIVMGISSCGPSKKELAAADSARRADSLVRMEAEKARIKQQLLDSIENENRNKKKESNAANAVKPLTQYLFISPNKEGAAMREVKALKSLLTGLGFSVKTFKKPADLEFGDPFTYLTASRKGNGGTTFVKIIGNIYGFESSITEAFINFANQTELDKFIESMEISNYHKHGNTYENPNNYRYHVEVDIEGLTATITSTFEC